MKTNLGKKITGCSMKKGMLLFVLFGLLLVSGPLAQEAIANPGSQADELIDAGNAKVKAGKHSEAIEIFTRALSLDGGVANQATAYFKRGQAYFELGKFDFAISDYSAALKDLEGMKTLNDFKSEYFYNSGRAYDKTGNLKQAVSDYTSALELLPDHLKARNNRAVAYYKLKEFRLAVADCDKYLAHDTKWASIYYTRGAAKIGLKDKSAIPDLIKAAKMGNGYAQDALRKAGVKWQ